MTIFLTEAAQYSSTFTKNYKCICPFVPFYKFEGYAARHLNKIMITKIFFLLNNNSLYRCPPEAERKSNSSNKVWLKKIIIAFIITIICTSVFAQNSNDTLHYPEEKHFKNIQQLTFGGDNAEAYWSYDDARIIFQRTNPKEGITCDRMFIGIIPQQGENFFYKQVSSGKGRTTCGYFLHDGKHIIYASTHLGGDS